MVRWFGQWRKTRETPGATNIKIKKQGEAGEIKRSAEKDTRKKKEKAEQTVHEQELKLRRNLTKELREVLPALKDIWFIEFREDFNKR